MPGDMDDRRDIPPTGAAGRPPFAVATGIESARKHRNEREHPNAALGEKSPTPYRGGAKEGLLYCSVRTRTWRWGERRTNLPRTVCTGNSPAADCDRQHTSDALESWRASHPGSHRIRFSFEFPRWQCLSCGVGSARRWDGKAEKLLASPCITASAPPASPVFADQLQWHWVDIPYFLFLPFRICLTLATLMLMCAACFRRSAVSRVCAIMHHRVELSMLSFWPQPSPCRCGTISDLQASSRDPVI